MKSERDKQRYREWRQNNPDKVREQRKRRYARSIGILPPYEKPAPLSADEAQARHIERMKKHHQKRKERMASDPEYAKRIREQELARHRRRYDRLKADPVAYQAKLDAERNRRRLKKGIPLDKPVMSYRLTDEERAERKAEQERRKAERAAARAAKPPKLTPEERLARRKAKRREYDAKRRDLERARRAAEVANDRARYPTSLKPPKVCPDPPELQALFKKASKGEPPKPYSPTVKKRSAFQLRGWV